MVTAHSTPSAVTRSRVLSSRQPSCNLRRQDQPTTQPTRLLQSHKHLVSHSAPSGAYHHRTGRTVLGLTATGSKVTSMVGARSATRRSSASVRASRACDQNQNLIASHILVQTTSAKTSVRCYHASSPVSTACIVNSALHYRRVFSGPSRILSSRISPPKSPPTNGTVLHHAATP